MGAPDVIETDGQSIASRLAKQINRITKLIKKDIDKYNNDDHGNFQNECLPLTIGFDEIKDPDCAFWLILHVPNAGDSNENQNSIPFNVKRKAIDLCHLSDRAKEEQVLLKDEMRNTFHHYRQQHDLITDFIMATDNDNAIVDEMQFGELLFCRRKLLYIECRLLQIQEKFSPHIGIEIPRMIIIPGHEEDDVVLEQDDEVVGEENEEEVVIINPLAEESDSDCEYESDSEFATCDIFL
ncbi:Hypothetical predicted protein [Paramuricea clavata]|uniref:Uncharacterized protein n=1 Tax=Paramuricea clavata TaxID=317549 RepID=A0A6S7KEM5_PARCT|nr:Hypothetical predicted protein [Paramuricea clavata]